MSEDARKVLIRRFDLVSISKDRATYWLNKNIGYRFLSYDDSKLKWNCDQQVKILQMNLRNFIYYFYVNLLNLVNSSKKL